MAPLPPLSKTTFTPYGLNFGNVPESSSSPVLSIVLKAIGMDQAINITPLDARYTATPNGDMTIPAGTSITVDFQFNASAVLGSSVTTFFRFQGGGVIPESPQLQAVTVAGGSAAWLVTPNPYDYGSLKIGFSGSQLFTITNNDTTLGLNIATIVANFPEFTVSGEPTLPVTIPPGDTITFTVTCIADTRGVALYPAAVTISPDVGDAQSLNLSYTGFEITPAFTLTGATQGVLVGLGGMWDNVLSNYVAQSLSSLACEADAYLDKQIDFGNPSSLTNFNRAFMRVDPLGACTVTISDTCIVSNELTTTQDTKTRVADHDDEGISDTMIFDLQQNGEIHKFRISVLANQGILSIIYLFPAFEPRGSVYERT